MRRRIVVTGGTGRLGQVVVERLAERGVEVQSISRRNTTVSVDLRKGTNIDQAIAGAATIVHCATTNGRGDIVATRNLIEAAKRAGGPHLVYVSIVGVDRVPMPYYRAKLAVEQEIAASGLPWTIVRATQFHELVAQILDLAAKLPIMPLPTGFRFQPIDTGDVADRLAALAFGPPQGRVPDLGGPQILDIRQLAHTYLMLTGKRRKLAMVPVPGAIARAYREGHHLAPGQAVGRRTFEEFLAG
ncbi:SDR family oxidoreductase [Kutzneria chonburiensis]|uniref:SDR family oxidoreductase n=1 Tax=Kutzneria chonburiensis TaxID=1483604 RepID=A0ABV6N0J6_9PSEU|nr:NAD(P)H-binding protein [Kutzneria chonburiensis]